ncbi:MAG: hypothetical protein CMH57_06350 [Myxococcales bacterium]|nr:hypothetical protein [Myxococcales bacterium]
MTLTGSIPTHLEGQGRSLDRRDNRLDSAWLMRSAPPPEAPSRAPELLQDPDSPVALPPDSPALILLATEVPAAAETARRLIQAGRRVYLLAPSGWSGDLEWLSGASPTQVLARRVREAPVAAVLGEGRGWVWAGAAGPGPWRLTLSPPQIDALRQVFLRLYWDDADDEGWPANGQIVWRARGEAPFDIPRAAAGAVVRLERADDAQPDALGEVRSWYAPERRLPEGPAARVWVPASQQEHGALSARARAGCQVVWRDLKLPLCWTGARPTLMPRSARWSLPIRLDPSQAEALEVVLQRHPQAVFEPNITLQSVEQRVGLEGRVWLPGRPEPEPLIEEQPLDAGVAEAPSLRAAPGVKPDAWPEPAVLALRATWRWKVRVPTLPKGASPDPLIQRWEEVDADYAARTERALTALATLEEREGALRRVYASLKSALLGFGRSRGGLLRELEACAERVPSRGTVQEAREGVAKLAALEGRIGELGADVDKAEDKAFEEAERERQREAHEKKRQEAQARLIELKRDLAEVEERLLGVDQELEELKQKHQEEDTPRKDRKAAEGRLRSDQRRFSKQVSQLEARVQSEQAVCDEPFEYTPSRRRASRHKGASSFVPKASAQPRQRVPDEELPRTGALFRRGKGRLLAIARWEQLELGEREAKRLGADLVASVEEP